MLYETTTVAVGSPPDLDDLSSATLLDAKIVRGDRINTNDSFDTKLSNQKAYILAFYMGSYDETDGGGLGAEMSVGAFGAI